MNIPDFIVHYNRSEPFRSISEVSQGNLRAVLNQLDENNSWGLNRFADPAYLSQRLKVEQKVRSEFIVKGGVPELEFPIYFFLGNNVRFEEHKKNVGYKIKLGELPTNVVSFTYGDSMFSMCDNYRHKLDDEYQSRLCSQVYRLDELNDLFSATNGMSKSLHIECQLWIKPAPNLVRRVD